MTTGKCKPDVAIYKILPTDWFNDVIYFTQSPIIAIEVLSPKQAFTELTDKAHKQYFPAGGLAYYSHYAHRTNSSTRR